MIRRPPIVYVVLGAVVGGLLLVPATVFAATGHPLRVGGDAGVTTAQPLPGGQAAGTSEAERQMIEECLKDMREARGQMMGANGMADMMNSMMH